MGLLNEVIIIQVMAKQKCRECPDKEKAIEDALKYFKMI